MKKILITLMAITSTFMSAGQIWTQYDFKVNDSESAAKIVAASDELMAAEIINIKSFRFPFSLKHA